MGSPNHSLDSFVRRIHLMMVYRTVLKWAAGWLMMLGVIVLVARFAESLPGYWWAYALGSFVPLIGAAWYVESGRRPDAVKMRAAFDRENNAGGLVMAEAEVDTRSWEARKQNLGLPQIHWRARKAWFGVTLGAAFLLIACLVPVKFASLINDPPLEVGQKVEQLNEQINLLEEEEILTPEEAEAKRRELERIAEQASGFNPAKTLEALDHLLDTNKQLAEQEAEDAMATLEALSEAELLGKALENVPEAAPDNEQLDAARKQFADMLKEMAENGALDPDKLPPELKEMMKELAQNQNGGEGGQGNQPQMNPEQMKQLLEALGDNKDELMDLAKRMMENGLIPPDLAQRMQPGGEGGGLDPNQLADLLQQGGIDPGELQEMLEKFGEMQLGGNGGINRGPGPAPLQFGAPSSEDGTEFKEEKLGPSVPLDQAKLAGVTRTAPKVTGGEAILTKGALGQAGTGGGSARTAPVLPRHRGAVSRFFDRPAKPD